MLGEIKKMKRDPSKVMRVGCILLVILLFLSAFESLYQSVYAQAVTATITGFNAPCGVAVTPNGAYAYVTNINSNTVSVINTATNAIAATVNVGGNPYGVAVTPNGAYAYVVNTGGGTVSVINTATNTVKATVNVGSRPFRVAITPNSAYAYVTNYGSNSVSVINTATNTVTATVNVGSYPYGVAVTPNGAYAYVTNQYGDSISVINTATNAVTATISVGFDPFGVAFTPSGAYAYVTAYSSVSGGTSTVSVIATVSNTVTATVTVGVNPSSVVVTPNGAYAYVANQGNVGSQSGTVSVINTATNTVTAIISVGGGPYDVAVTPNGAYVYVANQYGNSVSVISTATSAPPTPTPPTATQVPFSPTVDGFQFNNDIPKQAVSYSDALSAITSASWAQSIPSQYRPMFAFFSVEVNQMQWGNCFGMSYTAKQYYENPDAFASKYPNYSSMYAVSESVVSSEILANQCPGQELMQPYLFNLAVTYLGLNSLNQEAQYIMNEVDNYQVVQLYLINHNNPFFLHSVLVFNYEISQNNLVLEVYDPNHQGETRTIWLNKDQSGNYVLERTGAPNDMVTEYGLTNIGAGEYTNINWSIIADHMNELVQTVENFLSQTTGSFLGIKVACPVNLLVTAPNSSRIGYDSASGQFINELSGVFYSGTDEEPKVAIIPNPENNSYDIMLSGTATGNYTLTVDHYNQGELIGTPVSTNGTIEAGLSKEYTLQLTGTSQASIAEIKTNSAQTNPTDYTPYIILAVAIVVAAILIGVGVGRRKSGAGNVSNL